MPREFHVLIYDALQACERIQRFLSGKTLDDYRVDELLQSAVERQFGIVGEALNVARQLDHLLEEQITDLSRIVRTRNFLVHAYHAVLNERLWQIAHDNVPLLIEELRRMHNPPPES